MAMARMTPDQIMAKIAENHYAAYIEAALRKGQYSNGRRTRREIRETLRAFPGLKPALDTYFFNDGSEKQLISLCGTIPVFYKGQIYNTPVIIWVMDTHPWRCPKVYLQPTPHMRIKPSRHVDKNGRIILQKEWLMGTSSILALLCDIIDIFEKRHPLYSV